jgi:pimeloyl-ACP methyl ester carboxylesterase
MPVTMTRLHVEKTGTGPPLVAIHGFGASLYTWHAIRQTLEATHTVHAFDLKGHGLSPKPDDGKYSVHDQAALIADYIKDQGLSNVTLVGHSFGGGVSLALALDLIQHAPGTLGSLVVIDGAAYNQPLPGFIRALRLPILGALSQYLLPISWQVRIVLRLAFFHDERITDDAVAAYGAALRMPGGRRALRETARQILPADIEALAAQYPTIHVPALIIWGREDQIVPLWVGERLSAALPNARLVVFDQVGHVPHEETPDPVRLELEAFL